MNGVSYWSAEIGEAKHWLSTAVVRVQGLSPWLLSSGTADSIDPRESQTWFGRSTSILVRKLLETIFPNETRTIMYKFQSTAAAVPFVA